MKIAVVGCAHGQLEVIYDTVQYLEEQNDVKIDLLLCCGDFQATRNLDDLTCMACPPKYRDMCSFYKYYSGEKVAPVMTIFIGGNHEASNHLQELPYGGWAAPKIYYMGYAGVVNYGGVRIAGLSGIFNGSDFCKGRYEKPPYNDDSMRSCYHTRNLDIFRLKQLSQPVQIMITHDWPNGIYNHGNLKQLLRIKPYFKSDIETDTLGSEPTAELLSHMKPDYWFSAHLHVKFAAYVKHDDNDKSKVTKFLALDKCLPRRKFLQVVDIQVEEQDEEPQLKYDLEWLTILHLTNNLLSVKKVNCYMPSKGYDTRWNFTPNEDEMDAVKKKFGGCLKIPENFKVTTHIFSPNSSNQREGRLTPKFNPQTIQFCGKLGVDDPIALLVEDGAVTPNTSLNATPHFESNSFVDSTDSEFEVSSSSSHRGISPLVRSMSKTPLRLPKPLNSSGASLDDCLTSTPYKEEEDGRKRKSLTPSTTEVEKDASAGTVDDQTYTPGTTRAKIFRRRNLAMYASTEDD